MPQNHNSEIQAPIGLNLYQDKKNRTIYKHPFLKKAVYIPTYDYKTFELYKKRYILVISVFVVLFMLLSDWFSLPWWVSIVCSAAIWLFLEWKFLSFLKKEQVVKHFEPQNYSDYYDTFDSQSRGRFLLKIVLYVLIGILIVYNSYYSGYDNMYTLASWAVLVLCLGYALFQLYIFFKIKSRAQKKM